MAEEDPWREFREGAVAAEPIPGLPSRENPWADFVTGPAPSTPPTARITVRPQGAYDTFKDVARTASNAATYGQMDRVRAGIDVATGDQPTYDKALADAVRKSKEAEERSGGFLTSTGQAIGGLVGGGALPAAGVTLMRQGQPLAVKTIAGLAEGFGYGAAQGAGNTYTGSANDYASNALMGGVLGGGIGAAAPLAGKAGSAAYHGLANKGALGTWGGLPKPLTDAARADAAGLHRVAQSPVEMLPDAGPSMLGTTMGANIGTGGAGKTALSTALRARDRAMPQRITGGVNQLYGPAALPSRVAAAIDERVAALSPHYENAINNARAVDNSDLALWIEGQIGSTRGEGGSAHAALQTVRRMLDIPTNPGVLDPHPRALQATREQVRGMRDDPNADPNTRRLMTTIERRLTEEMHRKIPGIYQLDSARAELGAQERALQTQSAGGRIFKTDQNTVLHPEELAEAMERAAVPKGASIGPSLEPIRLRQAARYELERIIGTNKNDLLKLENVLGQPHDWNAQKLSQMFGEERGRALFRLLDQERAMRETYQQVVQGSKTATTTAAAAQLDAAKGNIPVEMTAFGATSRLLQEAVKAMRSGASEASRDRVAALMATQSIPEKQALVQQLLEAQPTRDRRGDITRWLIEHGLIGAGTATTAPTTRP